MKKLLRFFWQFYRPGRSDATTVTTDQTPHKQEQDMPEETIASDQAAQHSGVDTAELDSRTEGNGKEAVNTVPPIAKLRPTVSLYDTEREPEDASDLARHPHQKLFPPDGGVYSLRNGWQVVGASRRGFGHAYNGSYREDDFSIGIISDEGVFVAIADGLGSRAYSRRGALAAVEGATSLPTEQLQRLLALVQAYPEDPRCREEAYQTLMEALRAAHTNIEQQAEHDQIDSDEFKTTLLVFVAIPCQDDMLFLASVQVGDGALLALQPREQATLSDQWRWLQQQQIQEVGSVVQPFLGTNAALWSKMFRCEILHHATLIMGMTDGTADDIEPPRPTSDDPDPDPFLFVQNFYQHLAADVLSSEQFARALLEFLGYRKRASFDDRTVVCFYHREEATR